MSKEISQAVIRRLPRYYRYLGELLDEGVERISSNDLSHRMKVTASQIRQDLNNFGGFGQQGYGYNVQFLYEEIGKIMGLDTEHRIIIIGAGNLGQALANYVKFEKLGFVITALFDVNPDLSGKSVRGIPILMLNELGEYCRTHRVDIAALTMPKSKADTIASKLVELGIKAIWNFAHVDLEIPDKDVVVESVHLSDSLMQLSYNIVKNSKNKYRVSFMNDKKDFEAALKGKNVPLLVLDQKWHRLFAIHGKTDEISATEKELDELLKLQGKYNNELKDLKKLKSKTMTNIVANMGDDGDEKRDKDKQLIDEINEKADNIEGELIEIQKNIKAVNDRLMLLSMDYFSEKIEKNKLESKEIDDWIANIRVELKKNVIRKQNRDINNREIYSYLHDIFGAEVLDLFDIEYDDPMVFNANNAKADNANNENKGN